MHHYHADMLLKKKLKTPALPKKRQIFTKKRYEFSKISENGQKWLICWKTDPEASAEDSLPRNGVALLQFGHYSASTGPNLPVKRFSNMAWFNHHHQWGWLRHRGWLRHLISHISIQLWLKKKLVPEKFEMPSTLFREGIRLQKMQNTKLCNFGLTPGQKSIPLFTTENCLK